MGGLMGALNASGLALQAQEQVIAVISNNVANAQTSGYAREEANLAPTPAVPVPGGAGEIGTGVQVTSVTRDDSAFLDRQAYAANSALSQYQTMQNALGQVETVFNEPSQSSLANALSSFWQSWSSLGNDPSNAAARTSVIAQGQSVAETFNGIAKQLTDLQQSLDTTVADQVTQVNQIAGQIAQLNQQISEQSATGQPPNDLLDERGQLLTKLSGLVQFREIQHSNGTDALVVGGVALVDGAVTTTLQSAPDPTNYNFQKLSWAGTNAAVQLGDGSMGANLTLRDQAVPGYLSQLDTIASQLTTAVNGVHAAGYGTNGTTGLDFFTGTTAATIAVNPTVANNPDDVAAATAANAPGDGSNALAIADLENQALVGSSSIGGAYGALISRLGVDAQTAGNAVKTQQLLLTRVQQEQQSVSGVDLNEEMTHMVSSQHAYQAASDVINVVNQMLQSLLSTVG